MEVPNWKQVGLARGEPFCGGGALTLRAMAVAAAVVGNDCVGAVFAARHMATERCRAAALDRTHHLHLVEADVSGIGTTPRRSVVAEDIRDLQRWTGHGAVTLAAGPSCSSWASCEARTTGRGGSRCRRSCRWRRGCSAPSCRACRDPEAVIHNPPPPISLKLKGLLRGIWCYRTC